MECHSEKLVHYLQGQDYIKGLYNQNMTVSSVSFKLLVHLQPNLVWWYSIISQSVLWKNGITAFKVKVTAKVQNVSECLNGSYVLHVSNCVCSIFLEPLNHFFFFTKLGMVGYYHEATYRAEKLVHYLQCQGHSEGLYNQNQTLYTVSSELVHLQPNLIW